MKEPNSANIMYRLRQTILAAAFVVPLQKEQWVELKYNKIPANQVTSESDGLKIKVESSASPLVYKFDEIIKIQKIKAELEISGKIPTPTDPKIWMEDAYTRLGLVATGPRRLNWIQRQIAADWVVKLFALAPPHVGLDKIYFYNVGPSAEQIGMQRTHPKSDLLQEEMVAARAEEQKKISIEKTVTPSLSAAALWISTDGDDTKSSFTVLIKKIEIERE